MTDRKFDKPVGIFVSGAGNGKISENTFVGDMHSIVVEDSGNIAATGNRKYGGGNFMTLSNIQEYLINNNMHVSDAVAKALTEDVKRRDKQSFVDRMKASLGPEKLDAILSLYDRLSGMFPG